MELSTPYPRRRSSRCVSPLLFVIQLLCLLCLVAPTAAYQKLSDAFLRNVTVDASDFDISTGALLSPILIPRVPGTENHGKIQAHFVDFFRTQLPRWTVSYQNSTQDTPSLKKLPFTNLIFRREPPWTKPGQANLLTLVAHYDSKITPTGFIGAIDSAVPCAVLMHVARFIDSYLSQMHDEMVALGELGGSLAMDMGVQILLLDGEEAFVDWTATDSLYGARSLAAEWELPSFPPRSNYRSRLDQVPLFVLLDLLGSPEPRVPSYFQTTHWAYRNMADLESRMRRLGLLESKPSRPFLFDAAKPAADFRAVWVQDDHVPFMARGVPTLHVIPSPFPAEVWHRMEDDGAHLHMNTVRDWARIVTAFTLEWLDMMEISPE